MWRTAGRIDDFCRLGTLTKWNAAGLEGMIMAEVASKGVSGVVMGGDGKKRTFLVVERRNAVVEEEEGMREGVWAAVERVNEGLAEEIWIGKEMILWLDKGRGMPRVAHKGVINRRKVVETFAVEIDKLYERAMG